MLDTWAEIRRLHGSEGMAVKAIARRLGVARNTVRAALASDRPPRYERPPRGSAVDPLLPQIGELLTLDPSMPANVIAEKVGWTRSASVFRAKVAEIRPLFAGVDPTDRTEYEPGGIVQCDLWTPNKVVLVAPHVEVTPPVLTMVSAWCGFMMAVMIPSKTVGDLLAGMWRILRDQLGAVPRALVWDHETGIGQRKLTEQARSFAGTLGCRIVQVKVRSPEHKGIIERSHGFLETSFEPGRVFTSPDDFNAQLAGWLPQANARVLRRTGRRPADLIDVDRAAMKALPPVDPATGFDWSGRVGRDYYVRILGNDYSVDPVAVGRRVDVHASLDEIVARCGGDEVARHRRLWTTRQVVTDPAHREHARQLRAEYDRIRAEQASRQTTRPGHLVALRALSDYDDVFDVPDFDPPARPSLAVVQ